MKHRCGCITINTAQRYSLVRFSRECSEFDSTFVVRTTKNNKVMVYKKYYFGLNTQSYVYSLHKPKDINLTSPIHRLQQNICISPETYRDSIHAMKLLLENPEIYGDVKVEIGRFFLT